MIRTRNGDMIRTRFNGGNGGGSKMGRPTKYRPWMCDEVIELMSEGKSRYEVARDLDVHYDSLLNWAERYPDFFLALKRGEARCRAWWEKKARDNIDVPLSMKFNTGPWLINMINRFGWKSANAAVKEEVSGRVEQVHTERKELRIEVDLTGLDDKMLNKLLEGLTQVRTPEGKQIAAEPVRGTLH